MNIISKLVVSDILKMLEEQFISHEPDLQKLLVSEVSELSGELCKWLANKINPETDNEEK